MSSSENQGRGASWRGPNWSFRHATCRCYRPPGHLGARGEVRACQCPSLASILPRRAAHPADVGSGPKMPRLSFYHLFPLLPSIHSVEMNSNRRRTKMTFAAASDRRTRRAEVLSGTCVGYLLPVESGVTSAGKRRSALFCVRSQRPLLLRCYQCCSNLCSGNQLKQKKQS